LDGSAGSDCDSAEVVGVESLLELDEPLKDADPRRPTPVEAHCGASYVVGSRELMDGRYMRSTSL